MIAREVQGDQENSDHETNVASRLSSRLVVVKQEAIDDLADKGIVI